MSTYRGVKDKITGHGLNIVEVEWIDSASTGGWRRISLFENEADPVSCWSVGYLVKRDRKQTLLLQSHDGTLGKGNDAISIPSSIVRNVRILKKAEKGKP